MRLTLAALLACLSIQVLSAQTLTWTNRDIHQPQHQEITELQTEISVTAWRGEQSGVMALLQNSGNVPLAATATLSGPIGGSAKFVDYVLTDDFRACGKHPDNLSPYEVADIISTSITVVDSAQVRPIWVSLNVSRQIAPGQYVDTLTVGGSSLLVRVNVQEPVLPEPNEWQFYLNLWQQPYSVARYYDVAPWSQEHFRLLKPYAQMLAAAGQKTISTILIYEPWGEQSNDKFLPMVEITRKANGSMEYDYTVFDKWVDFMLAHGVGPDIECFSMIPWEMSFRYFDEATGKYQELKTTTDTPEYEQFWGSYLANLSLHLKQRNLLQHTMIAMDERAPEDMKNAIRIIRQYAPEIKISLAGNYHREFADDIYSLTITQGESFPPGETERRHANGQISSLYTCCSSPYPNIFSNSAPADAEWLPTHAVATGHDGYLHWSWLNWTDSPLTDSRFKLFAPGDTYFIYPDGKSSIRFERLKEGIQLAEKIRILRQKLIAENNTTNLARLDNALMQISNPRPRAGASTASQLTHLKTVINSLSEK